DQVMNGIARPSGQPGLQLSSRSFSDVFQLPLVDEGVIVRLNVAPQYSSRTPPGRGGGKGNQRNNGNESKCGNKPYRYGTCLSTRFSWLHGSNPAAGSFVRGTGRV